MCLIVPFFHKTIYSLLDSVFDSEYTLDKSTVSTINRAVMFAMGQQAIYCSESEKL